MPSGIIIKVSGGNFYIKDNDKLIVCKASGKLRDYKIIPVSGDIVNYEKLEDNNGYIKSIEKRKNSLIRPPVSNIDQALIVSSLKEPDFSSLLLEKLLLQIIDNDITPVIYFSKIDKVKDLSVYQKYFDYYSSLGIKCFYGNSLNLENKDKLEEIFSNKKTILTGQSGAGKSTLLNGISPNLNLKTGDFSFSLGRGKHTTREVEFLEIANGLVADTPGFSSLKLDIDIDRLATIYPGFNHFNECKFRGCMHDKEIGCKIKEEVDKGIILKESYDNYLKILNDLKGGKNS
jgi:ribosome biogenesis GTPase